MYGANMQSAKKTTMFFVNLYFYMAITSTCNIEV